MVVVFGRKDLHYECHLSRFLNAMRVDNPNFRCERGLYIVDLVPHALRLNAISPKSGTTHPPHAMLNVSHQIRIKI